jgi:RNA polymerase sigma-70 factor (ECF subfamily)
VIRDTQAAVAKAREEFLVLVEASRPELHRYCARLTGSVIEGEDIVQEALAKAFYALALTTDPPALRPWLFKIAHNTAMDFLKSHGRRFTDPVAEMTDVAGFEEGPDPLVVRAALARFIVLPVTQRSAVILKDVLGMSLEDAAETMGTTVMAVKAALVRGRAKLRDAEASDALAEASARADLSRYATAFNARDWDGLRAMIGDDCQLDLVSRSKRRGREIDGYLGRYAKENVRLRVGSLEGQLVLAAYVADATEPSYFVLLTWESGHLRVIRDFRYVPYVAREADFKPL